MVAVAPSGRVFVANIGSSTVTAIDPETRATRHIPVGQGPEGIAVRPGGREVWVVNRYADTLSVIDTETLGVTATVPTGPFPIRLAFTPDGRHALVTCLRANEVWVHDAGTREKVRAVEALSPWFGRTRQS